jgi:hypothetical protein
MYLAVAALRGRPVSNLSCLVSCDTLLFLFCSFIWCATTLTVSRFILNLRHNVSEQQHNRISPDESTGVPMALIMTERTFHDSWTECEKC